MKRAISPLNVLEYDPALLEIPCKVSTLNEIPLCEDKEQSPKINGIEKDSNQKQGILKSVKANKNFGEPGKKIQLAEGPRIPSLVILKDGNSRQLQVGEKIYIVNKVNLFVSGNKEAEIMYQRGQHFQVADQFPAYKESNSQQTNATVQIDYRISSTSRHNQQSSNQNTSKRFFNDLRTHTNQTLDHVQSAANLQANTANFSFQARADYKHFKRYDNSGRGCSTVERPLKRPSFNPRGSHSYDNFQSIIGNVFQQRSLATNMFSNPVGRGAGTHNENNCQNRSHVDNNQHLRSQSAPISIRRQHQHPKFNYRNSNPQSSSSSCSSDSMSESSESHHRFDPHKKAAVTLSNLPYACYKPECTSNCADWVKVVLNSESHSGDERGPRWFFMSTFKPIITFTSNFESKDFPHYHIYHPLFSDPHQVGRKMQSLPIPNEISILQDDFNFSVLSYNVLADELLWQNKSLYRGCPDWTLKWNYRRNNLIREIESYNADVSIRINSSSNFYKFVGWESCIYHCKFELLTHPVAKGLKQRETISDFYGYIIFSTQQFLILHGKTIFSKFLSKR